MRLSKIIYPLMMLFLLSCSKERVSKRLNLTEDFSIQYPEINYNSIGGISDFYTGDDNINILGRYGKLYVSDFGGNISQEVDLNIVSEVPYEYMPLFYDKIFSRNEGGFLIVSSSAQTRELIIILLTQDYQLEKHVIYGDRTGNYVLSDAVEIEDEILLSARENNYIHKISKTDGEIVLDYYVGTEEQYEYKQFKIVESNEGNVKLLKYSYDAFPAYGVPIEVEVYDEEYNYESDFILNWGKSFNIEDALILDNDLYVYGQGLMTDYDNQLAMNACFTPIKKMQEVGSTNKIGSFLDNCEELSCFVNTDCIGMFPLKNGFVFVNNGPGNAVVGTMKKNGKLVKELEINNNTPTVAKKVNSNEYYVAGYDNSMSLVITKILVD